MTFENEKFNLNEITIFNNRDWTISTRIFKIKSKKNITRNSKTKNLFA